MERFEKMVLGCTSLKPSMWLRYVDDIFIIWPQQEDVQRLLDQVNSIHPSIQFTMEKEQDNKLLFLNALVTCTEQGFRLSVYCKPPFTGQYLNFNSYHPYIVKKGCNIYAYQGEMFSLRHNFYCNNYPESITSAPRNLDRTIENDI